MYSSPCALELQITAVYEVLRPIFLPSLFCIIVLLGALSPRDLGQSSNSGKDHCQMFTQDITVRSCF